MIAVIAVVFILLQWQIGGLEHMISSAGISLGDSPAGYLCRSCASAFGCYTLRKELTENLDHALDKFPNLT